MASYLEPDEIGAVRDAAIAVFADPQMRPVLFQDVLPAYTASLPHIPAPAIQITSDLMRMNGVERLVDGSVPLQIWLQNAARLTLEAGPQAVFRRALDKVATAASGEPELGSAADTAELKEEIIFYDDTVPFDFLMHGAAAGAAVGRLTVPPYEHGVRKNTPLGAPENPHGGTGWLITPTLLLTNHHVVNARSAINGPAVRTSDADLALQAAGAIVRFDYNTESVKGVEVACASVIAWDPALDYAVLRLANDQERYALPIRRTALVASLKDNVAVNIIQHPAGRAKRIGLRNNIVHDTNDRDIRYFTDTERGSSGSPVLTDDWVACGLHRGSQRVDIKFQGKTSAYVNVGTQISAILDDLEARYPAVHREVEFGLDKWRRQP